MLLQFRTTDYTALSNKPKINSVELSGNKTSADLGIANAEHSHTVSNISDFPTSLPASDVSEWAKSPTKPTYTASEVGALPNTTTIPTKTSQLTNDSNYVVDNAYVHTDNNFTSALKSSYDNAVTNSHTHSNKSVLDNTTASYTTEEKTKLANLITLSSDLTLTVAGWDSTAKTQTITGLTIDTTKLNTPLPITTSLKEYASCGIYLSTETSTSLTFTCDTIPTNAITFKLKSEVIV